MNQLVLLTGMSGAGRSTAFKMMEDLGFYCVDNLPVPLLKSFVDLVQEEPEHNVAVGIDVRSGENLSKLQDILDELKGDQT